MKRPLASFDLDEECQLKSIKSGRSSGALPEYISIAIPVNASPWTQELYTGLNEPRQPEDEEDEAEDHDNWREKLPLGDQDHEDQEEDNAEGRNGDHVWEQPASQAVVSGCSRRIQRHAQKRMESDEPWYSLLRLLLYLHKRRKDSEIQSSCDPYDEKPKVELGFRPVIFSPPLDEDHKEEDVDSDKLSNGSGVWSWLYAQSGSRNGIDRSYGGASYLATANGRYGREEERESEYFGEREVIQDCDVDGESVYSANRSRDYRMEAGTNPWRGAIAGMGGLGALAVKQAREAREALPVRKQPLRKQLKDEAKRRRNLLELDSRSREARTFSRSDDWELTVGIEIHAQLNTERKLFSDALASNSDRPNSNTALLDLAFPGSQPIFQKATLIPALRAAIALGCRVERISKFDRKHYFYQDQPAGYQITQYYEPFAKDGHITLFDYDGIAPEDGQFITVGIKQIQMEQDTAKTIQQPPDTMLLDFNRVGHPLVEIITLPQIHHPQTAAACVRKIQSILQAVNAVTTGMEMGGLRADINVSVRPRSAAAGPHSYCGIKGLGQRTEIKNLSSFKAVEDAVTAERDRQIAVLEGGGFIEGETRGWTLGSTETKKLRGKEGEVDYRYMPDPDLAPVVISAELIYYITESLPLLPDEQLRTLTEDFNLSVKDARTLIALDEGERLDYFYAVVSLVQQNTHKSGNQDHQQDKRIGKVAANWIVHELGGLLSASNTIFSTEQVPAQAFASILESVLGNRITGTTAKKILSMVFDGDRRAVDAIIEEEGLAFEALTTDEYEALAQRLLAEHPGMVEQIRVKRQVGKLQFFVGQMVRAGGGKVEAKKAEAVFKRLLGIE
ncbi:hypothetical protein MMC13_005788 [Lambiella insularis]|nr:hypothetical protein [Lambiella insularis]